MRKFILGAAAVAGLLLLPASAAFAGVGNGTQPGAVAMGNTVCAGHGAFGAFGNNGVGQHDFGVNNPGSNGLPGASNWQNPSTTSGLSTGGNNSSLCGNGASPAPFTTP